MGSIIANLIVEIAVGLAACHFSRGVFFLVSPSVMVKFSFARRVKSMSMTSVNEGRVNQWASDLLSCEVVVRGLHCGCCVRVEGIRRVSPFVMERGRKSLDARASAGYKR